MISRLVQLRQSVFVRNTATLSGGQMIATVIGFASAPILSRLYSPQDYGVLAAYMAVAVILGAIANFQMARAIVAEADDQVARALLKLALLLSAAVAFVTLVILILLASSDDMAPAMVGQWLALLPMTVLASGTGSALISWANRQHRYRLMGGYQIMNVAVASGSAMAFGWLGIGPTGLMIGYFLGQLAAFLLLLLANLPTIAAMRRIGGADMAAAGRLHQGFAKWTTPTAIIEQVAASSPVLVLSYWANMLAVVGHFNRARSLVGLPLGIGGGAIGQVFFRRAAQDVAAHGHCRPLFWKMLLGLTAISVPTFVVLALIAPQLFAFVLGPAWFDAGYIVRILAPSMALQLIVMPTSKVLWIHGRQRLDFLLSIIFTTGTTGAVAAVAFAGMTPIYAIYAFAGMQILFYLAYLICSILLVEQQYRIGRAAPVSSGVTL